LRRIGGCRCGALAQKLVVGTLLASNGVVGLWAIGEYAVDLQTAIFTDYTNWQSAGGVLVCEKVDQRAGRRCEFWAYVWNMLGRRGRHVDFHARRQAISRRFAFSSGSRGADHHPSWCIGNESPGDAYWMMPLMGAAQLGVLRGSQSICQSYFPQPVRSTGVSFCYNLGRFAAAAGSFYASSLSIGVFLAATPHRSRCAILD